MIRAVLISGLAASAVACVVHAAETKEAAYPTRPVRVIVPFAPGGPSDILGRLMSQKLTESLGRNVTCAWRAGRVGAVEFLDKLGFERSAVAMERPPG